MLNDAQNQRLLKLFGEASELPYEERAAFVACTCQGDHELARKLLGLLDIEEHRLAGWLTSVRDDIETSLSDQSAVRAVAEKLPTVDGYEIVSILGRGGMGIVYEAIQISPRRRVALKTVHPGTVSDERLRRLQAEGAVLARLQHPVIAQIHEMGTCDVGGGPQPFFAMEFVEGGDVITYANRAGLGLPERMRLIATICDGVQHAHEAGVTHRDLKPDNILVDGEGRPRILDFGIARAAETAEILGSMATQDGQLLGTVGYMAPEQLTDVTCQVSALGDLYALGVIAFEVACGRRPHALEGLSLAAALRVVEQSDPQPLGNIDSSLRGDIETVVGKALARDPQQRYASASAFADDLRRFVDRRPIMARAPSRLYLARKFAERNRGLVSGMVTAVLALVVGIVVSLWFAFDANEQRLLADDRDRSSQQVGLRMIGAQLGSVQEALKNRQQTRALDMLETIPQSLRAVEWGLVASWAPRVLQGDGPKQNWPERLGRFVVVNGEERILARADGRLQMWDLKGEQLPDPVRDQGICAWAVANEGSAIAIATKAGGVYHTDLATGERQQLAGAGGVAVPGSFHMAVGHKGESVAWVRNRHLFVWQSDQPGVRELQMPQLRDEALGFTVAFVNGNWLVVSINNHTGSSWASTLVCYDLDTDREHSRRRVIHKGMQLVAVPERNEVAIRVGNCMEICAVPALTAVRSLPEQDLLFSFDYSPDGSVYVTTGLDRGLELHATEGDRQLEAFDYRVLNYSEQIDNDAALSSDSRWIVTSGPVRKRLHVIDRNIVGCPPDQEFVGHSSWVYQIAISPDGSLLASAAPVESDVLLWDARTGDLLARLPRGKSPEFYTAMLAFSPDSKFLLTTPERQDSSRGLYHVWDLETGSCRTVTTGVRLPGSFSPPLQPVVDVLGRASVTLHPRAVLLGEQSTAWIVEGSGSAPARMRQIHVDGSVKRELEPSTFTAIAADHQRRWLVSGHANGVDILDFETAEHLQSVAGISTNVQCVAFSPDDSRIAVGCNDGRVFLVETRFFETVLAFDAGHADSPRALRYVNCLAWSPDGQRIFTGSGDGRVCVWSVEHAILVEERVARHRELVSAAAIALRQLTQEHGGDELAARARLNRDGLTLEQARAARVAIVARWAKNR